MVDKPLNQTKLNLLSIISDDHDLLLFSTSFPIFRQALQIV